MTMVMERRGVDSKQVKRLEVWEIDLGSNDGSVQSGIRPCVILGNDKGNKFSPVVIVSPLTSKIKKPMPTHVYVNADDCEVFENSIVLCEHIITIDKKHLHSKLFELPMSYLKRINRAVQVSLGL